MFKHTKRFTSQILILFIFGSFSTQALSEECFHGWIGDQDNDSATGFCWNRRTDPDVSTDIRIDPETNEAYIHGVLGWGPVGGNYKWFDYDTTSCEDVSDSETVITGVNSAGEHFKMLFTKKEYNTVPNEAYLYGWASVKLTINGTDFSQTIDCWKHAGQE